MKTLEIDRVESLLYDPPPIGCVLYMSGLPGAGSVIYDRSPYGSHGAFKASEQPNWVWENGLWVMDFNAATTDYVVIPAAFNQLNFTSENFSIIARLKVDDLTNRRTIFMRGGNNIDGYWFWVYTSGEIYLRTFIGGSGVDTNTGANVLVTGTWYTVGFSRDGAAVKIYRNGVDVTFLAGVHINPVTCARAGVIGYDLTGSLFPFDGKIAHLSIYNYALTAGQHMKEHTKLSI